MDIFCKRLQEERKANKLTQKMMAEKLGISLPAYISYEQTSKHNRQPDLERLVEIADILNVSIDYLLGRKEI